MCWALFPGSMTAPGFIVKGKGENASLNSAVAWRRKKNEQDCSDEIYYQNILKDELDKHHVKLIGGGLDEAPQAYKDIEIVMQSQKQLIDIAGKFYPKIVKMDGASSKPMEQRRELG